MDTGSSHRSGNTASTYRSRNNNATTVRDAHLLGPNGTVHARRPNPNATANSRSARQRLSEAGEYVEEGGYYDALPHAAGDDSFESAASIISDA